MENKEIFKLGDKVFCALIGHGIVNRVSGTANDLYPIEVKYSNGVECYTVDGRYCKAAFPTLSFSEYTLDGFSQKRSEILPEKGQVVWVRDDEDDEWVISHFVEKQGRYYGTTDGDPFSGIVETEWEYLTTENPYKNEN